jgi:hypothetical protein
LHDFVDTIGMAVACVHRLHDLHLQLRSACNRRGELLQLQRWQAAMLLASG